MVFGPKQHVIISLFSKLEKKNNGVGERETQIMKFVNTCINEYIYIYAHMSNS